MMNAAADSTRLPNKGPSRLPRATERDEEPPAKEGRRRVRMWK